MADIIFIACFITTQHIYFINSSHITQSTFSSSSHSITCYLFALAFALSMDYSQEDEGPEFYKIIHPTLNTTQHLQIPPDFVKHISEQGSVEAILEGPSGNHWLVKFCRTEDDGAFLTDGWHDFVDDHSLGNYEVLFFRYDGDLHFHVQIFDKSATEKEDAFTAAPRQGSSSIHEASDDSHFVEIASKRLGRQPKNRTDLKPYKRKEHIPPHRIPPSEEEIQKMMVTAMSFGSTLKHPYFFQCLTKASVLRTSALIIPRDFAKYHLPKYNTEVILEDEEGQTWTMNFVPYIYRKSARLGRWANFVIENKLEEGDICLFERIAQKKLFVHILRRPRS